MAEKYRVGFYSVETDNDELGDRLVAHAANISLERVMKRTLTEADYTDIAGITEKFSSGALTLTDAGGWGPQDIFSYALSKKQQVIFIDYLQLLAEDDHFGYTEKVSKISQSVKTMARKTGINVIGLSQFTRKEKTSSKNGQGTKAPIMSDLRGSGQLEQDADVILLLYRTNPDDLTDRRRELDIAKNKVGRLRNIPLWFNGETQTFQPRRRDETTPSENYQRIQKEIRKAAKAAKQGEQYTFTELSGDDPNLPF